MKGQKVTANARSGTNIRTGAGLSYPKLLSVSEGNLIGYTTGNIVQDGNHYWIKVLTGKGTGYVRNDVATVHPFDSAPTVTDEDAGTLMNYIVSADKRTYKHLIYIAELIERYKKKGIDVSKFEAEFRELSESYNERQNKIREQATVKEETSFSNSALEWLKEKWSALISGVGAIPIIIVVAVAALAIGAGGTVALYYAFKDDLEPATLDLQKAETLAKVLEMIEPKTKQKLIDEINDQLIDAQESGYNEGRSKTFLADAKYITIAAVGLFFGKILLDKKN